MPGTLLIRGGRSLGGTVSIGGSYEAALTLLAAAAAAQRPVVLHNLPSTRGVLRFLALLSRLGHRMENTAGTWVIEPAPTLPVFPETDSGTLRQAILLLGPLLARWRRVEMPLPEGGVGHNQAVDLHLKALSRLGASVAVERGRLLVEGEKLEGTEIVLDVPGFAATWTAVTAATAAKGRTQILGCSRQPELVDAVTLLNCMGARVSGAGTERITVIGTGGEELGGGVHEAVPDRLAAAFYLLAAAGTGGEVKVKGVIAEHLRAVTAKLEEMGVAIRAGEQEIGIRVAAALHPVTVRTSFYPGFPSFLQPVMCSVLLAADGTSLVSETYREGRPLHLDELQRLGGQISQDGPLAVIRGPGRLSGARLRAKDAASAQALVIAALMAGGESIVHEAGWLEETLEDPVGHLGGLGAAVEWLEKPGPEDF
ncbi:MAG TPA: UDP-N-acetylglucosamine 1-carboxyvinyltransferase [Firmicutes bacterium]|nr:UDP-N-acetylglucosamine 1-carboxyvinyltransferase [Bacillota bacterium]